MTVPRPRVGENYAAYQSRFGGSPAVLRAFPDADDRRAVCKTLWDNHRPESTLSVESMIDNRAAAPVSRALRRAIDAN